MLWLCEHSNNDDRSILGYNLSMNLVSWVLWGQSVSEIDVCLCVLINFSSMG